MPRRAAPSAPAGADVLVVDDNVDAGRFAPDVALLDIGLPVIALPGYGQEQDRERSAAAGFETHLVKPLDLALLRAVIESMPQRPR